MNLAIEYTTWLHTVNYNDINQVVKLLKEWLQLLLLGE